MASGGAQLLEGTEPEQRENRSTKRGEDKTGALTKDLQGNSGNFEKEPGSIKESALAQNLEDFSFERSFGNKPRFS